VTGATEPREYPARPIVGVGAVVLVEPGAPRPGSATAGRASAGVVLVRRRYEPLAGRWSLPGGALDVGETLAAGVAREVAEETGLTVRVGPVVDVLDRIVFDPDRRVRYHFVLVDYLCRPIGGQLRAASDAMDVAVADVAGLEGFALTEEARAVIGRAVEMAGGLGDRW
jgi:8-oxo-dGTP diphosphatase